VLDGDPAPPPQKGAQQLQNTVRGLQTQTGCLCNAGVLWPNGRIDQGATWCRGRPRFRPHCVRWGHSSPMEKGASSPHFCNLPTQLASPKPRLMSYCAQTAGWIRMPLGTKVCLRLGDIVLDGDQAPNGMEHSSPPPTFIIYGRRLRPYKPASV